jgi:hypothetical protein
MWSFREANSANTGPDVGQNLGIAFAVRCFTINVMQEARWLNGT